MDSFLKDRPHITLDHETETAHDSENLAHSNQLPTLNLSQSTLTPESGDAMEHAKIETIFESGILRRIIVHCDCGKELILECQYE